MITENYCQSCGMPLDNREWLGTEKDGSKNHEYCRYCYQEGSFINPGMTLKEMTSLVITQMEKMKMSSQVIDKAITTLPHLKRWALKPV